MGHCAMKSVVILVLLYSSLRCLINSLRRGLLDSQFTAGMNNYVAKNLDEYHQEGSRWSSLLQQMAPTVFTMKPDDPSKILFPAQVEHVLIDIGVFLSDYLAAVEQRNDPTVALILVDPLPQSLMPVISGAALFNEREGDNYTLRNRVFVLQGALGETETRANFQMSQAPACGSLLKPAVKNSFWCWDSVQELIVSVFQLEDLLDMIPKSTAGIKSIHVKVDTEGADHFVLKGGGKALERLSSVVIECGGKHVEHSNDTEYTARCEGMCNDDEVIKWMCEQRHFCDHYLEYQGGLSNIFFWNHNASGIVVPDILTEGPLVFGKWYRDLKNETKNSMTK